VAARPRIVDEGSTWITASLVVHHVEEIVDDLIG
jgi:hypothetical protein